MASQVLYDWGTDNIKIWATEASFLETRFLCWHLHQPRTALCSRCGAAECLSKGLHKRMGTVEVKGPLWCLSYGTVRYSTLELFMLMGKDWKPTTQLSSSTKTVLWTPGFGDVKSNLECKWVIEMRLQQLYPILEVCIIRVFLRDNSCHSDIKGV